MIIGEFGDCRGRSGGAATLHPQSVAGKDNCIQGVENTVQPSGRLGPEGDRYGVPSQRRPTMIVCAAQRVLRARADAATKIISALVEGRSCAQHQRGVHNGPDWLEQPGQ
jgi:hypothetical protein